MSNIRRLPLPDRLTAEELHVVIHNADEKDKLWTLLKQVDFDQAMEVSIKPVGKDRSTMQNRMVWQWFRDAEKQGSMKAWEYRSYAKLHFGVPILRRDSESYKEKYDRIVKPLSYEVKRELMVEPMEFPVSSAFNKKQMVEWLDAVKYWLESEGIALTNTEEMFS